MGWLSLLVALSLSGCSAIKLGYNNIADVAYWWLDGYVDFEDAQSARVREDLQRLHAWHRAEELPRAGQLLGRLEAMVAGDVTSAQVCAFLPQVRERFQAVGVRAEPAVVTTAIGFTPGQLAHLERKYAQKNAEFRKDWLRLSRTELADKRLKQWTDRAEMIYGTLGDAQRSALREQLRTSAYDPQRVLAERERRQQDTLQTLRSVTRPGLPLDQARQQMRGLLERLETSPDPAYRTFFDALSQEACRTLAALHNAAGPEQRENAARRLRAYQRDLQELAAAR